MSSSPANAVDVQSVVESRLAALLKSPEARQTATVEWRGRQLHVDVIDMPTNLVYFNPDTHRIRAQRSLDPDREHALESDPYGDGAQLYLHDLLRGTPQDPTQEDPTFAELKNSLAEHGQEDPGIITRSGVLVNGNTRCAALRELHRENIRVGVLPPDAGAEDVRGIELSLQLRKEFKRDYSFVNFLLAIKERSESGQADADIINEFRIREKTLQRSRWILAQIEDVIDRSRHQDESGNITQLRLIDFETDQGKLEELYRAYSALKIKNPEQAEALREQRLLALVLDKSKTDLRLIEPDFVPNYLPDTLPQTGIVDTASKMIPGTTIPLPQPSKQIEQLRAITNNALRAKATIVASNDPDQIASASNVIKTLTTAVDGALDKAGRNARIKKRQVAPAERISDAVDDLGLAVQAIAEARSASRFTADDVEDVVLSLRDALVKVAQQVNLSRTGSDGDGVKWLLGVVAADVE